MAGLDVLSGWLILLGMPIIIAVLTVLLLVFWYKLGPQLRVALRARFTGRTVTPLLMQNNNLVFKTSGNPDSIEYKDRVYFPGRERILRVDGTPWVFFPSGHAQAINFDILPLTTKMAADNIQSLSEAEATPAKDTTMFLNPAAPRNAVFEPEHDLGEGLIGGTLTHFLPGFDPKKPDEEYLKREYVALKPNLRYEPLNLASALHYLKYDYSPAKVKDIISREAARMRREMGKINVNEIAKLLIIVGAVIAIVWAVTHSNVAETISGVIPK